jgi:hypothetical protein
MTQTNGTRYSRGPSAVQDLPVEAAPPERSTTANNEEVRIATRTAQRARQQFKQNRFVILAAGALVFALLVFALVSAPKGEFQKKSAANGSNTRETGSLQAPAASDHSLLPITDSGRPPAAESRDGYISEQDLNHTAKPRPTSQPSLRPPMSQGGPGTLGSIPPFGEQAWQAPPYQPGMNTNSPGAETTPNRIEHESEVKSSLIYVRNVSNSIAPGAQQHPVEAEESQLGLGLPVGTRLRARLESAASTAVRTPVLAVIEYNYERDGEIVVPAGAKAVGHIQEADRSGYIRIEFDSLLMPDGTAVSIQAAATDLDMRPIKGKVEGKNTGKNVLVRSLSGIGQAGALLVGRNGLNQPFSESDVIRERVSSNIGQASDEQISRLAITSRVVVSVSAGTAIYVVLEQSSKQFLGASVHTRSREPAASPENLDQLRQLLQLQQELNQQTARQQTAAAQEN